MDQATRELVRERAGNRCEYCGLHQSDLPFLRFHTEHIIARQHGGSDHDSNLALACNHCNLHKGPNLSAIVPQTKQVVPLFHPRRQRWTEHFVQEDIYIIGLTPVGRATVQLLKMNDLSQLELRSQVTPSS